jgi:hypothetical protein
MQYSDGNPDPWVIRTLFGPTAAFSFTPVIVLITGGKPETMRTPILVAWVKQEELASL